MPGEAAPLVKRSESLGDTSPATDHNDTPKPPVNLAAVSLASLLGVKKHPLKAQPTNAHNSAKPALNTRWTKVVKEEVTANTQTPADGDTTAENANRKDPADKDPDDKDAVIRIVYKKLVVGPTLDEAAQVARRSTSSTEIRRPAEGRLVSVLGEANPRVSPSSATKSSGLFGSGLPAASALLSSPAKWAPFPSAKSEPKPKTAKAPLFNNDLAFAIGKYTQKLTRPEDEVSESPQQTWRRSPNVARREVLRKAFANTREQPPTIEPPPQPSASSPLFLQQQDGGLNWTDQFPYQSTTGQNSQLFDFEKLWEDSASSLILDDPLLDTSQLYSKTVTPPCHVHPGLARAFANETAPRTANPFVSSTSLYGSSSVFSDHASSWCQDRALSFPATYGSDLHLYGGSVQRQATDEQSLI